MIRTDNKSDSSEDLSNKSISKREPQSDHPASRASRKSSYKNILLVNRPGIELPNIRIDKYSHKSIANNDMTVKTNMKYSDAGIRYAKSDKHIILFGESGITKTSFAKDILNYECIVVETFRDIKKFDPSAHKGIIFENIDFSDINIHIKSSLVEKTDRGIYVGDTRIILPADMKLIFTTTIPEGKVFGPIEENKKPYKACIRSMVKNKMYRDYDSDSDYEDEYEEANC